MPTARGPTRRSKKPAPNVEMANTRPAMKKVRLTVVMPVP
jgi:hypothetical protein